MSGLSFGGIAKAPDVCLRHGVLPASVEFRNLHLMPFPVLSREEELYWLALKLIPGLGTRTSGKLLDRFRTPQAIFRASRIGAGSRRPERRGGAVHRQRLLRFEDAAAQQQKMLDAGAELVTIGDPRYPQPLREIFDPPMLLFARGRVELLQSIMLGVVGTRRPTPYGLAVAERLSADLAHAGLTIVSGMARGIDTAAHRGALAAGGDTVAVLGCGVDVVYPSENRKLAAEIAAKGLIVSEFPMGATAFPQNFPDSQSHHQRYERGRAGGGRRAVQRIGHYGQAGDGPGPGGLRGSRQHHLEAELGA